MATRVLATPEAATAITQIESILNSGLAQTIQNLNQQGQVLSEPNVWDGNLADDFRNNVWPACSRALTSAHTQGVAQSCNAVVTEKSLDPWYRRWVHVGGLIGS